MTLWAIAQGVGMLIAVGFAGGLVLVPSAALTIFWYGVMPVLPAIFFLSPRFWRGVCPLATLNQLGNRFGTQRSLGPRMALALNVTGMILFYLLVPARHFAFNHDGRALAIALVALGGLAVALGTVFAVRSAFCNALCPILPVELLYGMAPLVDMHRGRCATCTVCTPRGCVDLAGRKTLPQRLGPQRRAARWILTPYGVFFAALPGFIFGYNQVTDGPVSTAGVVYAATLGWSFASFVVTMVAVLVFRLSSRRALPLLAASSGGIYYWYSGLATPGAPAWLTSGIRILGIGLVAVWLARTFANPDIA